MRTGRPERLRCFDYIGFHRYFLTFCTFERRPYFTDAERVALVRAQILRSCREEQFALAAYCFMPDHVHLLVEASREDADGRKFIRRSKQYAGFYFKKTFGEPLWQHWGYERVLRDDEAALDVARYIVENPVRANLVGAPQDYPFLGSEQDSLEEIVTALQFDGRRRG